MEVIRSLDERKQIDKNYSIAQFAITRRFSASSLHDGHLKCIDICKSLADKVLILLPRTSFHNNLIHGDETDIFKYSMDMSTWDESGYIDWLNVNDVDYVHIQEKPDVLYYPTYDITELREWAKNICSQEGYTLINEVCRRSLITGMITDRILNETQDYRRDYRVASSKDSYFLFHWKHFVEKYTDRHMEIIEPLIEADTKFPLSTHGLLQYTNSYEMETIKKVPSVIFNNQNTISQDVNQYKEDVINEINSLDQTGNIHVMNVEVHQDPVLIGVDKAFVEIELYLNHKIKSMGVIGRYPYCVILDI